MLYDDICFFSNEFDEFIGDVLVGNKPNIDKSYYSPDSTSTGNLKKRWKIINGKKCLLKAGTKPYQYEIFNEIIASKIMDILGINHIDYELYKENDNIYCLSENFISYNEDFVTAYQLYISKQKPNNISLFEHLIEVYKSLNIDNYKEEINKMLFIDFLIGNTDRHLNNFGVIRDAKSLKFIMVAPIYDSGSSIGFDKNDSQLEYLNDIEWKPFKTNKVKHQLSLIDDFSWLNIKKLKSVIDNVKELLDEFSEYITITRRNAMINFLTRRVNMVLEYLNIKEEVKNTSLELSLLEKNIIKYIENKGVLNDLNELANALSVSYITIYRATSNLTKMNIIKRIGSRKTGYWVLENNSN